LDIADSGFLLGLADDRGDQAAGNGDGHADIGVLVLDHVLVGPGDIGVRHIAQRQRQRLDHHVVDRELVGRLVVFHGAALLSCDLRARAHPVRNQR
jgi:hypothetical protein